MKFDVPHLVIIKHVPEDGEFEATSEYKIFHPHACEKETWEDPVKKGHAFSYTYFTCWTGDEIANIGLEDLDGCFVIDGYDKSRVGDHLWGYEWLGLPEGAYLIRAWSSYSNNPISGEDYDGGLELIGLAPQPLTADEWQGLDDRLEV